MSRHVAKPRRPQVSPESGEGKELGLDGREIPSGLNHLANPETPAAKPKVPAVRHFKDDIAHGVPITDPDVPYSVPAAGRIPVLPPAPIPVIDTAVPVYIVEESGKGKVHRESVPSSIMIPGNASDPVRITSRDLQRVRIMLLNEPAPVTIVADNAPIVAGAGTAIVTLPAGATLTGLDIRTIVGAASTSTTVVITGVAGGPVTFTYVSPVSAILPFTPRFDPLPAASPTSVPTVTFTGNVNTGGGNMNIFGSLAAPADGIRFAESLATLDEGRGALLPVTGEYLELTTQGELWAISDTANPGQLSIIAETEIS